MQLLLRVDASPFVLPMFVDVVALLAIVSVQLQQLLLQLWQQMLFQLVESFLQESM